MIDARELRIGNHVLDVHERVAIISTISDASVRLSSRNYHYDSFNCSEIRPIPLTEEILIKCGFEKVNSDSWEYVLKLPNYESFVIEYFEYTDAWYYTAGEGTRNGKGWKYLHELQNGLHAIYGEDLNVNL